MKPTRKAKKSTNLVRVRTAVVVYTGTLLPHNTQHNCTRQSSIKNENEARECEARAFFFLVFQGGKSLFIADRTRVGCLALSFSVCVCVIQHWFWATFGHRTQRTLHQFQPRGALCTHTQKISFPCWYGGKSFTVGRARCSNLCSEMAGPWLKKQNRNGLMCRACSQQAVWACPQQADWASTAVHSRQTRPVHGRQTGPAHSR